MQKSIAFPQQSERLSALKRNRIAREIDDNLGDYLTIVGVQLEKAIVLDTAALAETGQAVRAAKQLAVHFGFLCLEEGMNLTKDWKERH